MECSKTTACEVSLLQRKRIQNIRPLNFSWLDVRSVAKTASHAVLYIALHFNYGRVLGNNLNVWVKKLDLENYIDVVGLSMSPLVYRDTNNIWRSNYKTSKKSNLTFHHIVYKKDITMYEKAYYAYLASIIPIYSEQPWIPEAFVDVENIPNLLKKGYIKPYLNGYILEKEEYL